MAHIFRIFKRKEPRPITREEAAKKIQEILGAFPPMNQREVLARVIPGKHLHANPRRKKKAITLFNEGA